MKFNPNIYVGGSLTAQSQSINFNNGTVIQATPKIDARGDFSFFLSANGGTNWENVSNFSVHRFSNVGSDLRWKIDGVGEVHNVTVQYQTEGGNQMVVTNEAKRQIALLIGGSSLEVPTQFILGSGTSIPQDSDTTLGKSWDRQDFTSTDLSTTKQIKWRGDWNTVELSGNVLSEWGVIPSGTGYTGSIWSRNVIPNLSFDGTNELVIEETWSIF